MPDDRIVQRQPVFLIPDNRRLPLIRNSDRRNIGLGQAVLFLDSFHTFCDAVVHRVENSIGVVFCPAWFRVDLLKVGLRDFDDFSEAVKEDEARGRGALVDGTDEGRREVVRLCAGLIGGNHLLE